MKNKTDIPSPEHVCPDDNSYPVNEMNRRSDLVTVLDIYNGPVLFFQCFFCKLVTLVPVESAEE